MGRDTANELSALLETDKLKNFRDFFNRGVEPNLTTKAFSAVRFSDSQDQPEFETLSELLDYYYLDKAARDRVAQQASDLIHRVQNELEKTRRNLLNKKKSLLLLKMLRSSVKRWTFNNLSEHGAKWQG